jgi:hypothetical protein
MESLENDGAKKRMSADGEYTRVSTKLESALKEWKSTIV